jgi:hypothetical protein
MVNYQLEHVYVEAVKKPFGPRLGAPVPFAVRLQREQSMTRVAAVFDNF